MNVKDVRTRLVRRFVLATDGRTPLMALWTLVTEAADEAERRLPVRWSCLRGRALIMP